MVFHFSERIFRLWRYGLDLRLEKKKCGPPQHRQGRAVGSREREEHEEEARGRGGEGGRTRGRRASRLSGEGLAMASVSAANLSTKAVDRLVSASLTNNPVPAFSEEVISDKTPRAWADLPEHLLLRVFEFLTRDDEKGRDWVSLRGREEHVARRGEHPPVFFFLFFSDGSCWFLFGLLR